MLNYNGGDFAGDFDYSVEEAEAAMGTADGLYGGVWIATWNRTWSLLNPNEEAKRCGVCLWGEHKVSRFFQYTIGSNLMDMQSNYQTLLEKAFSGSNRNPLNRPALVQGYKDYKFQVANSEGVK